MQPPADVLFGVVVVEDDAMVRDWVRLVLEGSPFRVVAAAESAADVQPLVEARRPHVLLIDYRLPDGVGSDVVRALRQQGNRTPALIMTANREEGLNETVREAGAQGTVLKSGSPQELLGALAQTVSGRTAFDVRHPRRSPGVAALSRREHEILRLLATGATNHQIAEQLEVGDETIKTMVSRIFIKLGAKRRAEAVAVAHSRGLL